MKKFFGLMLLFVLADSACAELIKLKSKTKFSNGDKVYLKDAQGKTISKATVECEGQDCSFDIPVKLSLEEINQIKRIFLVKEVPLKIKYERIASLGVGSIFFPAYKLGIGFAGKKLEHHLFLVQNVAKIEGYQITGQEAAYAIKSWDHFKKRWLGFSGSVGLGKVVADKPGTAKGTVTYLYLIGAAESKWSLNDRWELLGALGTSWVEAPKQPVKNDPNANISLRGLGPYFSAELRYRF